ncbi:MAG: TolC family protein [Cytophagaceae bacterium]
MVGLILKKGSGFGNAFVFVISVLISAPISAQTNMELKLAAERGSFDDTPLSEQLPSLDRLIQIALENSPIMKSEDLSIKSSEMAAKLERRTWHRNISGFYNYARGSQQFTLPGMTAQGEQNMLNGYRYGVNFNIPLSEFTTRRTRVRLSELSIDQARFRREQMEMEISRQVTAEYQNLITAQKILAVRAQGRQNAQLVYQMAEKQFKEGTLGLEEFSRVSDSLINAEAGFEMAKKEYNTLFRQFEELLGVNLVSIMKRK